jgi:rhomboid family GlyGly-CTERM serine protease
MNQTINFLKTHLLTQSFGLLTIALFAIDHWLPGVRPCLEFQLGDSALGQVSQLFTSHFLHWSVEHLFWDLGMFVVLCGFAERISRNGLLALLAVSAIAIPPMVAVLHPELETYRGLSGLDTALFGFVVAFFALDRYAASDSQGVLLYSGLLLAMVAKTVHEYTTGTIFVSDASFSPVPIAHVVGGVLGVAAALLIRIHSNFVSGRCRSPEGFPGSRNGSELCTSPAAKN